MTFSLVLAVIGLVT